MRLLSFRLNPSFSCSVPILRRVWSFTFVCLLNASHNQCIWWVASSGWGAPSLTVKFFSKLNRLFWDNLLLYVIFFDNKNKSFSGWPKQYFGSNSSDFQTRYPVTTNPKRPFWRSPFQTRPPRACNRIITLHPKGTQAKLYRQDAAATKNESLVLPTTESAQRTNTSTPVVMWRQNHPELSHASTATLAYTGLAAFNNLPDRDHY